VASRMGAGLEYLRSTNVALTTTFQRRGKIADEGRQWPGIAGYSDQVWHRAWSPEGSRNSGCVEARDHAHAGRLSV